MAFDRAAANLDIQSGQNGGDSRNSKRRNQQQQQQQRHNRSSAGNNAESPHNADPSSKPQTRQQSPSSSGNRPVKRSSYELAQQNHPSHLVGLHQLFSSLPATNQSARSLGEDEQPTSRPNREQRLDFFVFETNQQQRPNGMESRVGKNSSGKSKQQASKQELLVTSRSSSSSGGGGRRKDNKLQNNAGTNKQSNFDVSSGDMTFCQALSSRLKKCANCSLKWLIVLLALSLIIYHWPISDAPEFGTRTAPIRERLEWSGSLAMNENLEQADLLFSGQFNAPESMAWNSDKRSFYTGVEGGFILFVEPYYERWSVVARLNARNSVQDETSGSGFVGEPSSLTRTTIEAKDPLVVPFCTKDVEIYGKRAEFEPRLVRISRCSRPLGIRLAPNGSYLYVNDPLSGFYKIDLKSPGNAIKVAKLIDFSQYQADYHANYSSRANKNGTEGKTMAATTTDRVLFGDDIAADWGAGEEGSDVIYMTDCSRLVTLRDLVRLMLEYDDTGRVIIFDTYRKRMRILEGLSPTQMPATSATSEEESRLDWRNMSFPNGIELTANKSALLISDLNNRRVLMHHISGPLAGITQHLFWGPGHSDNIRRGLDLPDGRPTYWAACGCAVEPNDFELTELSNQFPRIRKVFLKLLHLLGSGLSCLGELLSSTRLQDFGFEMKHVWLTRDPLCWHGIVYQFTEQGEILRSFHAPNYGSNFRLLSEAHQVPLLSPSPSGNGDNNPSDNGTATTPTSAYTRNSLLYLGSVYYPYLGRLELGPLEE